MTDFVPLKLKAEVIYMEKMDLPQEDWGFYVVLSFDGFFEIYRWKISKIDSFSIFTRKMEELDHAEWRYMDYVSKDGLKQFVADKLGDLFQYVYDAQRVVTD